MRKNQFPVSFSGRENTLPTKRSDTMPCTGIRGYDKGCYWGFRVVGGGRYGTLAMRLRCLGAHVRMMSGGGFAVNESSQERDCSRHCARA